MGTAVVVGGMILVVSGRDWLRENDGDAVREIEMVIVGVIGKVEVIVIDVETEPETVAVHVCEADIVEVKV